MMDRICFSLSLALGRLLRSGKYSTTVVVHVNGERKVRKHRLPHAPFLVWIGGPLLRILDTGVRVLPQRDWEARERELYRNLHGQAIQVDADGALLLPFLAGETLAALLEDPELDESVREQAIRLAVLALAEFHGHGFTHGDAMAENVMVELETGTARWFDFETMHDPRRPLAWRRADDVRALLATCLLRTPPKKLAGTLEFIVDLYADEEVTRLLAARFGSPLQRPLALHLGQAPLSFRCFGEIGRLLTERSLSFGSHP